MAPSNTRSERIASRNGVSRRVGLIRLCYRARPGMREMTDPGRRGLFAGVEGQGSRWTGALFWPTIP